MTLIPPPRPFDHLVLAVRDLDAAAAFYRALGFHVGARNRHPWGTQNHIIQLNGAFLELISTGERFDSASGGPFAYELSRYLSRREGMAMLVLRSLDADADAAAFARAGVGAGRFDFGRKGVDAQGRPVDVGFRLAFARSPLIDDAGFFVCEQTAPQSFWSKAAQTHDNGARRLSAVSMAAADPSDHAEFLSAFTRQREMSATSFGLEIDLGEGGALETLTPQALDFRYGPDALAPGARLAAFRVQIDDLAQMRTRLAACGVPFSEKPDLLVVPAATAAGVAIGFERS
jgi:catechol 2,3-dioxygenase-like lactoylglutathione lyase family enzyme